MRRAFPEISGRGLAALGTELPALAAIRVALTGGRSGKFHVPHPDLRRFSSDACRFAKPAAEASTHPLVEVFAQICKKCDIVLPKAPDALWRAAAFAAQRQDQLDRCRTDREPQTWLGYARHAARWAPGDEEQFRRWLDTARTDSTLAADAAVLADAWQQLAAQFRGFLEEYAAQCPEVEAYNGARDAVRRCADTDQRRELDQIGAAVGNLSRRRARMYEPEPRLDMWTLVCGVWLAARSRGRGAEQSADLTRAAVADELKGTRVRDVTQLPVPPRTPSDRHADPAAWADAELALWWPQAVTAACTRLEEEFEAESAAMSARLLLVRDWPLTGTRDTPVAYLAASPVLGPVVPYGHREVDDYVSWSGGDTSGPSYAAVVAAPAHLVAKLEREQAAQPSHYELRFTAGGPVTGGAADQAAAEALLRQAFPFLPGDGDREPSTPTDEVLEQRRARRAADRPRRDGAGEERTYRIASALRDGYGCWIPDSPQAPAELEEMAPWLRWSALRLDVLCGRDPEQHSWATLFGTLEAVDSAGIALNPGGRHLPLHVPVHRIVALTGAPHWERSQQTPALWQSYRLLPAPPKNPGPEPGRLRVVPGSDGAR
ncbi:hypothetical protein [Streptomyces sp. NPDC027717]|uniref:hypothetical protein n=1 Tax=Streptomyces sp. NPDC027717 TaxID=3155765 RepID=UPI0033D310D4